MRIKSLQITGFKSFVTRTAFSFDYGISGIVGPNGCGKSNVVDAIRWAMGEQSPRRLRGKGMDDVIFAGAENRAPVGLAEVVLRFDNSDGRAPPDFAAYAEIEVARRLYKDGESEYSLNQTPCRLRDVLDFFRDTGIGTKGYTIVEQGRIAEIVSAKPEERRTLIEEAAGISKFRARRREAENKLAATEQNLLRVRDVLGEIRRHISSIERQARRAAAHKRLREQQRVLDLLVARAERTALARAFEASGAQLSQQKDEVLASETKCAEHEAELETLRVELAAHERRAQQGSEALFQLRAAIKELEGRIGFAKRERASILEARTSHTAAREKLQAELQTAEQDAARAADELANVQRALSSEAAATQTLATAEQTAQETHTTCERERDDAQRALTDATANIARAEDRLASAGTRREELARQLRSADEQLELQLSGVTAATAEQEEIEQGLRSVLAERERLMGLVRDAIAQHARATENVREAGEALRAERERAHATRARLESLGEVLARAEDVSAGARHLQTLPADERARLGLRGLLRDALLVDADCERAVEAVLAERAEGVLLTPDADALQILTLLQKSQAGRSVLILSAGDGDGGGGDAGGGDAGDGDAPIYIGRGDGDGGAADSAGDADGDGGDGVGGSVVGVGDGDAGAGDAAGAGGGVGGGGDADAVQENFAMMGVALAEKVRFRAGFENVTRALFAGVRLVDGLGEILAAPPSARAHATFVTRAGEVLTPDGVLRGGGGGAEEGLLSRAREVRELEAQVAGAADALAALEAAHTARENELAQATSELDNLRSRHHTAALAVAGREKDLERTQERLKTADEAQQGRAAERSEFLTAAQSVDAERARVETELANARAAQRTHGRALEERGLALAAAAREHARLAAELSAQRAAHAGREALCARLTAEHERAQKSVAATRVWIEQRETEIANGEERARALLGEIGNAETALTERLREEEIAGQSAHEKREAYEAQGQAVRALEETSRAARQALERLRAALHKSESAAREAELRVEHLDEQIRERWNVELKSWTPPVFDDAHDGDGDGGDENARASADGDGADGDVPIYIRR